MINRNLANAEKRALTLVGRKFKTDTGFIEKAVDIVKEPKILKSGKASTKRFKIKIVTEPITPKQPTIAPIPARLAKEGEKILRTPGEISKAPALVRPILRNRQELLAKRKVVARQLSNEIRDIEIGVRANYDVFDRTFTEQIRNHPKFQQLSRIADEGRDVMDKWSRSLVVSGIPSDTAKETIERNVGEYMARMYPQHLNPRATGFNQGRGLRLRLNGLKHRKDLTGTTIDKLVIKEPGLPTAIRVREISTSVANNKLFNSVAQNPEWSAVENLTGKMIKMPNTPALGALRDKWVIPEIAGDITQIVTAPPRAVRAYLKGLSAWKYSKVVLNPSTHARNQMSNSILLDLSGTNQLRQAQLMPRVMKDYLQKGPMYKQALADGAIGGEFVGGEVSKLRDSYVGATGTHFQKILNAIKVPFKKAGDVYQAEEQIAKMIKYTDVLAKGGTRTQAAKEAQKWLFNYTELPNAVRFLKDVPFGSPFLTFTYKALPRIAETLVENPLKIYKYQAFFNAWNESAKQQLGMTEEEYNDLVDTLPPWMLDNFAGMPTNLLMPWEDKHGRNQVLNVEYILPIGMAPEIAEKGLLKGGLSNPFFQILSDLQKNRDFRNKPIVPEEPKSGRFLVSMDEAAKLQIEHVYRQLAPSLAPALGFIKGGYSFEKLMAAIEKRPDFAGRVKEIPETVLDVLAGLKITPIDVGDNVRFRQIEKKNTVKALRIQLWKIMRNPVIGPIEKEKQRKDILNRIKKVGKD